MKKLHSYMPRNQIILFLTTGICTSRNISSWWKLGDLTQEFMQLWMLTSIQRSGFPEFKFSFLKYLVLDMLRILRTKQASYINFVTRVIRTPELNILQTIIQQYSIAQEDEKWSVLFRLLFGTMSSYLATVKKNRDHTFLQHIFRCQGLLFLS